MNFKRMRKGSALLIVLGLMSFMVVSAVSFAIYMRQSRMPSVYARRSSSSRFLLKAALANAITRIDGAYSRETGYAEGICDDPYPGIGVPDVPSGYKFGGNYWDHRVFMPFGPVDHDATVATLTLEGLAYLPPAIINEARVFSRNSRTARWTNLAYDAGRYAFCAIDVSDCFDINRIAAGIRRTSAASSRISFDALYEDDTTAKQLDDLLLKGDSLDNGGGFASLADFNIVAGKGTKFTPFMDYIGGSAQIYNDTWKNTISNALFITDTWFPATNTTATVFNLAGGAQPFKTPMTCETINVGNIEKDKNGDPYFALLHNLGGVGMTCLYDYLDRDSIPISYCIPTVETAGMVVGVEVDTVKFKPEFKVAGKPISGTHKVGEGKEAVTYTRTATKYALMSYGKCVNTIVTVAYPFKNIKTRNDEKNGFKCPTKFKATVVLKIFIAPEKIPCRVDHADLYPKKDDWDDKALSVKNGIVTTCLDVGEVDFSKDIEDEAEAVKIIPHKEISLGSTEMPAFWYVTDDEPNFKPYYSIDGGIKGDNHALVPLSADLVPLSEDKDSWWSKAKDGSDSSKWVAGGEWVNVNLPEKTSENVLGNGTKYIPHIVAWVKLDAVNNVEGDVKTVDIVPACPDDDIMFGKRTNGPKPFKFMRSGTYPLLEFRGAADRAFTLSIDQTDSIDKVLNGSEDLMQWSRLYAADPRFNFAPENWFAAKGNTSETPDKEWLKMIDGFLGSDNSDGKERDRDIFMFTSDQEYLQSIGELMFLPRVQVGMTGDASFEGGNTTYSMDVPARLPVGGDQADRVVSAGSDASGLNFACGRFFWTSFSPTHGDPIYAMKDTGNKTVEFRSAAANSFLVNPFTRDPRVMRSVVNRTPVDYFFASTNELYGMDAKITDVDAGLDCAFYEDSKIDYAQWTREDVTGISTALCNAMGDRALAGFSRWETAYDGLDWFGGDDEVFMGYRLHNDCVLHSTDRKFLYSYWRECFGNRQQLFIVFLRAEPLTVGGMGIGSLATAQLGARGIALVWRDPTPPAGNGNRPRRDRLREVGDWADFHRDFAPHRTRVLFYYQFD